MSASESKSNVPAALPRIARFERLGYGLFLHFGLYSQLGRGEWAMAREQIPAAEYNRLADTFTAVDFDARAWARLARESGMRYIVLTSRHHEGFSLYDARGLSTFDAPHSAAKRDLVAEFVTACRAEGIVPFLYHTTLDWQWASSTCDAGKFAEYLEYLRASVEVLCTHYGEIGGFWFDGNWSRSDLDWNEDRLYATIRRLQPEAIIINNGGLEARGVRGSSELDSLVFEQGLPVAPNQTGWPKYLAGEMCETMNHHWGVGLSDFHYLSPVQIIRNLSLCRKVGANYLLNVGPLAQGGIPGYEAAALRRVGDWVKRFEPVLREARPAPEYTCTGDDFVLRGRDGRLFYFAFDLPISGDAHVTVRRGQTLHRTILGLSRKLRAVTWVDRDEPLPFVQSTPDGFATLALTGYPYGTDLVVRVAQLELESE